MHVLDNNCIVSGGDEKVLRYFEAPQSTLNLLSSMCSRKINYAATNQWMF